MLLRHEANLFLVHFAVAKHSPGFDKMYIFQLDKAGYIVRVFLSTVHQQYAGRTYDIALIYVERLRKTEMAFDVLSPERPFPVIGIAASDIIAAVSESS